MGKIKGKHIKYLLPLLLISIFTFHIAVTPVWALEYVPTPLPSDSNLTEIGEPTVFDVDGLPCAYRVFQTESGDCVIWLDDGYSFGSIGTAKTPDEAREIVRRLAAGEEIEVEKDTDVTISAAEDLHESEREETIERDAVGRWDMADLVVWFVRPIFKGLALLFLECLQDAYTFLVTGPVTLTLRQTSPSSTNSFLSVFGLNDMVNPLMTYIYALSYFIMLSIFGVALVCLLFGYITDVKHTLIEIILRLIIAIIAIPMIRSAFDLIAFLAGRIYDQLDLYQKPVISGGLMDHVHGSDNLGEIVLTVVLCGLILIEYCKLLLEIVERFVVLCIIHIFSPMAAGCLVSRTTSNIFWNYIRMYFSQIILMFMNKIFLGFSALAIASRLGDPNVSWFQLLLLLALLQTAQKIDEHMKTLGLTVAQTGNRMLGSIMAGAHALGSALRVGKKIAGAGTALSGAGIAKAGALSGKYGLATAGTVMKNLGTDGLVKTLAGAGDAGKRIDNFANAGGLKHMDPNNKHFANAGAKAYERGQYMQTMKLGAASTAAARKVLAKDNAFTNATGIKVGDIKTARFDKDGNISGTAVQTVKDNNGNVVGTRKCNFAVSTQAAGKGHDIVTADGISRGVEVNADLRSNFTQSVPNNYEVSAPGGMSNLSLMSGISYDDARLIGSGDASHPETGSFIYNGDSITTYSGKDGTGDVTSYADLNSGQILYKGHNSDYVAGLTQNDFENGGRFSKYVGENAVGMSEPTFSKDRSTCQVSFAKSSKYPTGGTISVSSDIAKYDAANKAQRPVDLGAKNGHVIVTTRVNKK